MRKGCINGKGFTLIELLVVVLIIGILAAIALPQYQKAVRRARLTEAKVILKNLTDAQDMYFLRGGQELITTLSEWNEVLDSRFPESTANWTFEFDECALGCTNIAYPNDGNNYEIRYASSNYDRGVDDYAGHFYCTGDEDICTELGGMQSESWSDAYILP